MVLRFFIFIWGSIAGTILIVVLLVVGLKIPPNETISREYIRDYTLELLRESYERGGGAAVFEIFAYHPIIDKTFEITVRPSETKCSENADIGSAANGGCLVLSGGISSMTWLDHIMPIFLPLFAGLAISFPAALMLARRFSRPIAIVGSGLSDLADGDLHRRIRLELRGSDRELLGLGTAFDRAAEQLQILSENRERLFHDISHELRSPLARLQAALGLLNINPSRLEAMKFRMELDIDRMNLLIQDILTLARTEHVTEEFELSQDIDLIEILAPIINDANFEGQSHNITCRYQGPDCVKARLNPELLHRAFENVLRNAIRYSPPESVVDVCVSAELAHIEILIQDRGSGVPEETLLSIFEPFERGKDSTSGTGLGLAIAARAIQVQGGTICAFNREGGGLSIKMVLPKYTKGNNK
ncbi:MAG: hypothetical protein COB84_01470 [Rhodobacteraceae bacterium]|nr:MAG: hypothetical protein COB84_01470 [Paracoccaceae bacterium]